MLRRALVPCLLVLLAVPVAAQAAPTATAAKTCNISGKERSLGTSYVLSLKASGTSCGKAQKLVKAFHACRHENGKAGRCSRRVKGYRCSEQRLNKIKTQYDSKVSCKDGGKRVSHTYTQFT